MPHEFLHQYDSDDNTNKFSIPHSYRVAVLGNSPFIETYFRMWETEKRYVLNSLNERVHQLMDNKNPFAFAVAPSSIEFFKKDILDSVEKEFSGAINLSDCFSKSDGFKTFGKGRELSDAELEGKFIINSECYGSNMNEEIKHILLLDDVVALGNTFKGMSNAIYTINNSIEIITLAILRI